MKVEKIDLENTSGRNITLHILGEISTHLKKILIKAAGLITILLTVAVEKNFKYKFNSSNLYFSYVIMVTFILYLIREGNKHLHIW